MKYEKKKPTFSAKKVALPIRILLILSPLLIENLTYHIRRFE
jgi:hypothetical protein